MSNHGHIKEHLDEVAKLIGEYKLSEASLETEDFKIVLRRQKPQIVAAAAAAPMVIEQAVSEAEDDATPAPIAVPVQSGTPISSPMMGIFYSSSGPSSPAYVKEGDTVSAGQVIGLIEAMKVFNEIHATMSGTVKRIAVENAQLVNPGDPLMYIG